MQSRRNKGKSRICMQEHEKNKKKRAYKADEIREKVEYVCKSMRKTRKKSIQSRRDKENS